MTLDEPNLQFPFSVQSVALLGASHASNYQKIILTVLRIVDVLTTGARSVNQQIQSRILRPLPIYHLALQRGFPMENVLVFQVCLMAGFGVLTGAMLIDVTGALLSTWSPVTRELLSSNSIL